MTEEIQEYVAKTAGPTIDALLVDKGKIRQIRIPDDRPAGGHDGMLAIQKLIGNSFTQCFSLYGENGRRITAYCDDEFLLKGEGELFDNWNVVLGLGVLYAYPLVIGGPIVITATDPEGWTISLTPEELTSFAIDLTKGLQVALDGRVRAIHTLTYGPLPALFREVLDDLGI